MLCASQRLDKTGRPAKPYWPAGFFLETAVTPTLSLTQETADMLLDNLYSMMGATGTASILFGILALVGVPAWATVMCPKSAYTRLQRSR